MVSLCTTLANEAKRYTGNTTGGHNPASEEIQKKITFARSMSDSGFESKVIFLKYSQKIVACFMVKELVGFR